MYCLYEGKDKGCRICHQNIHVKPIEEALNYVIKSLQRIADMEMIIQS